MAENKKEVHKPDCSKMEYRYLGNTGLKVSVVGFGNWVNNLNDEMNTESSITDKLDNSFFTHSVELKKDDLIDDDNYERVENNEEEDDSHSLIKIIAVVIVILALVMLVTYFVLKQVGFSI